MLVRAMFDVLVSVRVRRKFLTSRAAPPPTAVSLSYAPTHGGPRARASPMPALARAALLLVSFALRARTPLARLIRLSAPLMPGKGGHDCSSHGLSEATAPCSVRGEGSGGISRRQSGANLERAQGSVLMLWVSRGPPG